MIDHESLDDPTVAPMLAIIRACEESGDYTWRNIAIYHLLCSAALAGWPCGIRLDPAEPEWPVVFIELPEVGQVSWHVPHYKKPWDGHTTEEKYDRITRYLGHETGDSPVQPAHGPDL